MIYLFSFANSWQGYRNSKSQLRTAVSGVMGPLIPIKSESRPLSERTEGLVICSTQLSNASTFTYLTSVVVGPTLNRTNQSTVGFVVGRSIFLNHARK